VEYADLGLVVTDEQHRFGVAQRAALAAKGSHPHTLVMSATPIPRTLALILSGDLDVSIIDELPPGRQPIETYAVPGSYHERIYNFIRKLVAEGRQAYIVCSQVSENDELPDERKAVTEYAKMLQTEVFPDLKVAFVHGKMKPKEKDAVMTAFAAGESLPNNVRGITADCGFTSPYDIILHVASGMVGPWVKIMMPAVELWARLLAGFSLKECTTLQALSRSNTPFLMIHGLADTYVPSHMTQAGFDACASKKELILVAGASHGTSFLKDRPRVEKALLDFFRQNLNCEVTQ